MEEGVGGSIVQEEEGRECKAETERRERMACKINCSGEKKKRRKEGVVCSVE